MAISIIQHRKGITQKIISSIDEIKVVKTGFNGFFKKETVPSREVSIEVRRGTNLIATDVYIFGQSNLNKMSKSTEKIYVPPYFSEGYNFSKSQIYDVTFGAGQAPSQINARMMVDKAVREMQENKNKIIRAINKQQADVLQTGVVTIVNGDTINFQRKAASMPDLGDGNYWNQSDTDPLKDIATGMTFIREEGNSSDTIMNVVMGREAFNSFINNDKVKEEAEWINIKRQDINMPQFDQTTGMVFHGQMASEDYIMNIWTYNQFYTETVGGETKYYLDPKNVVLLPNDFKGQQSFGAVPAMTPDGTPYAKEADFYTYSYVDQKAKAKMFEISSAPLAIPYEIDKIYTIKALA